MNKRDWKFWTWPRQIRDLHEELGRHRLLMATAKGLLGRYANELKNRNVPKPTQDEVEDVYKRFCKIL